MKKLFVTLTVFVGFCLSFPAGASAQGVAVQIRAPSYANAAIEKVGWRRHHRWWRHHHRHSWRWGRPYAFAPCRVVVRRHFNRWGEMVVVRRRVCY